MKIDSNSNINKAEVYHQKSSQSRAPVTHPEAHGAPEMHSMKRPDTSIKDPKTILPVGN